MSGRSSKSATQEYIESRLSGTFGEQHLNRLGELFNIALRKSRRVERQAGVLDEEARMILGEICGHARSIGLQAEHLIVLAKKAWNDLPETALVESDREQDLLARVISSCISEYYRADQNRDGA